MGGGWRGGGELVARARAAASSMAHPLARSHVPPLTKGAALIRQRLDQRPQLHSLVVLPRMRVCDEMRQRVEPLQAAHTATPPPGARPQTLLGAIIVSSCNSQEFPIDPQTRTHHQLLRPDPHALQALHLLAPRVPGAVLQRTLHEQLQRRERQEAVGQGCKA